MGHRPEACSSTPNRWRRSHPRSRCTGTAAGSSLCFWFLVSSLEGRLMVRCRPTALALRSLYKRRSLDVIISQQRLLFYQEMVFSLPFFHQESSSQIMRIAVLVKVCRNYVAQLLQLVNKKLRVSTHEPGSVQYGTYLLPVPYQVPSERS